MSNFLLISPQFSPKWTTTNNLSNKFSVPSNKVKLTRRSSSTKAFFFNPSDEPIFKEAIKEPVAFMGGIFAGLLRLDLNEEPLKEWINKTVEASGITEKEIDVQGTSVDDRAPQQIDIE
ncbi:hypothetical protein RND81_06G084100 [Saponaria officinalis]|uniref:Uncharacterized protein n=1 Tax=Saponaria officinalis TaxID=3572 RepID=A0AAW1K8S9_SAPOF